MKHQCTQHSIDHQTSPAQLSDKYCWSINSNNNYYDIVVLLLLIAHYLPVIAWVSGPKLNFNCVILEINLKFFSLPLFLSLSHYVVAFFNVNLHISNLLSFGWFIS